MHPKIKKFWEGQGWEFDPTYFSDCIKWWAIKAGEYELLATTYDKTEPRYWLPYSHFHNNNTFTEMEILNYLKLKAFW